MATDNIARSLATRALASEPRSFAELATARLAADIERIDSVGHAQPGLGAATYVRDERATAELMQTHPSACFAAEGGYFRLLGTADAFVTPEMFGCPEYSPGINQQPYIQAAVDYCISAGLKGVYFPQPRYELWSPARVGYAPGDGYSNTNHTGNFIVVRNGAMTLIGKHGQRTILHCKGPNGGDMLTDYQVVSVSGYGGDCIWRGAALKLCGTVSAYGPREADEKLSHLNIKDLVFLTDMVGTQNTDWPAYAPSHPSGARENSWDVSNKGIYTQQDRQHGDMRFENVDMIGWLGEAFYLPGSFAAPDLTVGSKVTMRNCVVKHTNGQALNPGGPLVLDIDGFYAENCSAGWEGGAAIGQSRIVNAHFRNCRAASAAGSNSLESALRPDGTMPVCVVDILCENCGQFYAGSFLQGRLRLIDTSLTLKTVTETQRITGIHLDVTVINHARGLGYAVQFDGLSIPGSKMIDRNVIRLAVHRTKEAETAGHACAALVNQIGSLGPGNVVYARGLAHQPGGSTSTSDNYVSIIDEGIAVSSANYGTTFDPTVTSSPDMSSGYMRAAGFSQGWSRSTVNLPSRTNYGHGAEITIAHMDGAHTNKIMEVKDGTIVRALISYKNATRFRCDHAKARWEVINPPAPFKAVAQINLEATPLGGETGPYRISAPGCRGYFQADVSSGYGVSLPAGLVVSAVRADTDAINFWVRNLNGADPIGPLTFTFTGFWSLLAA